MLPPGHFVGTSVSSFIATSILLAPSSSSMVDVSWLFLWIWSKATGVTFGGRRTGGGSKTNGSLGSLSNPPPDSAKK